LSLLKEYFTFTKGQRIAILSLLSLIVVLSSLNFLMPLFIHPKAEIPTDELKQLMTKIKMDSSQNNDSFNEKYKGLDEKQKVLIREYINNISNTNSLRQYINAEVPEVRKQISELKSVVNNEVVKIKIDETLNQLDKITKGTLLKENQIMALMLSYVLIKELKNIK
jgi:hypothetical protein